MSRFAYFFRETLISLRRNLLMTLAGIMTVAISLFLFGGIMLLSRLVDHGTTKWRHGVELEIFMNVNATQTQIGDMRQALNGEPHVKHEQYLNHAAAYREFKRIFHDNPDLIKNIGPEDLPIVFDPFHVVSHATKAVDAASDLPSAPQVPLGSKGPFSFYGKCYVNAAGRVEATTFIASTSNTGMFDTEAEDSGYVTPSTAENLRKLQDVTTTAVNTFDPGDGDKDMMATDGTTTIYGIVGLAAAKEGTPPTGDGPFGPGNRCMFGEVIIG